MEGDGAKQGKKQRTERQPSLQHMALLSAYIFVVYRGSKAGVAKLLKFVLQLKLDLEACLEKER